MDSVMFNRHPDFFQKLLPEKTRKAKLVVRGPKNPESVLGAPKKPLFDIENDQGVGRSQLQKRLRPIVDDFKNMCKKEKVTPMTALALIARSLFLDANGEHFDYNKGKFFQSILKGNQQK